MNGFKRFATPVLVAAAVALAGLGHYYLLYRRVYIWDVAVFYAAAALLLAWAYRRAAPAPERAWEEVRAALRRLGVASRGLLSARGGGQRTGRLLVVALAVANGLAALAAFWIPAPAGLAVAALLWAAGLAALAARVPWARRVRSRPAPAAPGAPGPAVRDVGAVPLRRHAVPLAFAGWLLLLTGVGVLRLRGAPGLLRAIDGWLQPWLAGLHVDVPLPPGAWPVGLLLAYAGMILIAWTGGGVGRLPDVPPLGGEGPPPRVVSRPSWRWVVLALAGTLVWLGVVQAAATSSTSWTVIPLWLATLGVQAVCWWRADRARGVSALPSRVERQTWLVALAVVGAFGVALYRLGDVPNSLWGDEGAFWWWARDLAAGVRISPFDLGVYGAFPVTGSLYQSLWVRLFGPTVWSWRLGSVVAGTLTLVPLFFLTRRLLGPRVAWSVVALMVSLPYFLAYARIGFNSIQPLLPVTLGLWLLVEAARRHSRLLAYLAGVACGMASLTYTSGHVGLVLAALVWLFLFVGRRPLRRTLLGLGLGLVHGWLLVSGPFVLGGMLGGRPVSWKVLESFVGNAFYGEALFSMEAITRRYPLWQVGRERIFFEPRLYALLIGRGLVHTALSMIASGVATKHYVVGPLAGPGAVFFLAGLAWALGRYRRLQGALWAAWVLVCALLLSVICGFPPRTAHMAPIIPALAVMVATGVWLLSDLLRRVLPAAHRRWARWVGVVLTVALALWGLRTYFVAMPGQYVPDLENVMLWRAQEMGRGSSVVFVVDEPYPSEFRVWGIDEFDLGVAYRPVLAGEVQAADFRALCGATCRVFYLPQDAGAVEARLRDQLGEGTVRTHVDAEGQTIGLEFVPR